MFNNFDVSASGLTAQRLRMDVIADNIANVNTTRTENGEPYRRKMPVFEEILKREINQDKSGGVRVTQITEDQSDFKMVFRPNHPDANEEGYISMPNIDITTEMIDMIDASRAYEANVTALNSAKDMALKALEIGRG
ncbi:MAG: flagellar basal body rod protein FlgC [bacterium]